MTVQAKAKRRKAVASGKPARSGEAQHTLEVQFDRVNHQRLMARLSQRVDNHALLELIGKMLKAKVVMPDGVVVNTEEHRAGRV